MFLRPFYTRARLLMQGLMMMMVMTMTMTMIMMMMMAMMMMMVMMMMLLLCSFTFFDSHHNDSHGLTFAAKISQSPPSRRELA